MACGIPRTPDLRSPKPSGTSEDGAAIGEARAMVSELDPGHSRYKARLVDYNADPGVTFADLQKFLRQLEERLAARMAAR
jgi:hypothetical protein